MTALMSWLFLSFTYNYLLFVFVCSSSYFLVWYLYYLFSTTHFMRYAKLSFYNVCSNSLDKFIHYLVYHFENCLFFHHDQSIMNYLFIYLLLLTSLISIFCASIIAFCLLLTGYFIYSHFPMFYYLYYCILLLYLNFYLASFFLSPFPASIFFYSALRFYSVCSFMF